MFSDLKPRGLHFERLRLALGLTVKQRKQILQKRRIKSTRRRYTKVRSFWCKHARRGYFRLQNSRMCEAKKIPWSVEENSEEEVRRVRTHLLPTDYFRIPHNALCLPRKFCIRYCVDILLGIYSPPKRIWKQKSMQNWGGRGQAECNIHMIDIRR